MTRPGRQHVSLCFLRVKAAVLLFSGLALAAASCAKDATDCPEGSERCACYGNGSCDEGLSCRSDVCVEGESEDSDDESAADSDDGSSGGAPQETEPATPSVSAPAMGGTGAGGRADGTVSPDASMDGTVTSSAGGVPPGGSTGATNAGGGATGGVGGGETPIGGSGGAAANGGSAGIGGVGGAVNAGSGGTGPECIDTSSDRYNCGECGRACANNSNRRTCAPEGCCVDGQCTPYLAECIQQEDGFETCDDYCPSIGEVCVAGCTVNNISWMGWLPTSNWCENFGTEVAGSTGPCSDPIDWGVSGPASGRKVRCCCSDTQP